MFAASVTPPSAVLPPAAPSTMSPPVAVMFSAEGPCTLPSVTSLAALLPVSVIVPPPAARLTAPARTPKPAVPIASVPFSVVVATPL